MKAIIRSPPKENSYTFLKEALLSAFAKSQLDKDTMLLNLTHLGDRDPRSVAREIASLNEDPGSLPRAVMFNLLPQDVRMALATLDGLDTIHKIAEQAYKVINMKKDRTINSVANPQRQAAPSGEQWAEHEVDAVNFRGRHQGSRGQQRNKDQKTETYICFPHKKFGSKAFSCKPGCAFADIPLASRGAGNGPAGR